MDKDNKMTGYKKDSKICKLCRFRDFLEICKLLGPGNKCHHINKIGECNCMKCPYMGLRRLCRKESSMVEIKPEWFE